ncbi:MAG: Gfo/Idh/MocA family protein, partial [bacterium]
ALRERVIGEIYYSRVAVGQYLPDWRPGADYRLAYSSRADQGGGVVLDLTHELDYLVWWFGEVEEAAAFLGHVSNLEITSEDVAQILLRFRDGVMAQVHMDYLRPRYYRVAEIVGSLGILTWNDSSGTVTLSRSGEEEIVHRVSPSFDRNTMFLEHMRCFLNRLSSNGAALISLEEAIRVQRVAVAAHLSCKSRAFVRPSVVL